MKLALLAAGIGLLVQSLLCVPAHALPSFKNLPKRWEFGGGDIGEDTPRPGEGGLGSDGVLGSHETYENGKSGDTKDKSDESVGVKDGQGIEKGSIYDNAKDTSDKIVFGMEQFEVDGLKGQYNKALDESLIDVDLGEDYYEDEEPKRNPCERGVKGRDLSRRNKLTECVGNFFQPKAIRDFNEIGARFDTEYVDMMQKKLAWTHNEIIAKISQLPDEPPARLDPPQYRPGFGGESPQLMSPELEPDSAKSPDTGLMRKFDRGKLKEVYLKQLQNTPPEFGVDGQLVVATKWAKQFGFEPANLDQAVDAINVGPDRVGMTYDNPVTGDHANPFHSIEGLSAILPDPDMRFVGIDPVSSGLKSAQLKDWFPETASKPGPPVDNPAAKDYFEAKNKLKDTEKVWNRAGKDANDYIAKKGKIDAWNFRDACQKADQIRRDTKFKGKSASNLPAADGNGPVSLEIRNDKIYVEGLPLGTRGKVAIVGGSVVVGGVVVGVVGAHEGWFSGSDDSGGGGSSPSNITQPVNGTVGTNGTTLKWKW
ncbi:hypothetical protein ACLMJK_001484 [Lecanora helva]